MATLPIMQPRRFYDLAVEVAIIRPGPIVGDLVHPYLNRRTGREDVDYIHPHFKPILKRTLGVPLFQEQVLRMAMVIAGFSGVEADFLRKAMSFKRSDERMNAIVNKLKSPHERTASCTRGSATSHRINWLLCALRLSRISRYFLCSHRLRFLLAQSPPSG
jgi:error-prone DNA polymerase